MEVHFLGLFFVVFLGWIPQSQAWKVAPTIIDGVPDFFKFKPKPFEQIGDRYYYIETKIKSNWFEAYEECRRMNSSLVAFDSMEKYEQVHSRVKGSISFPKDYWTSGTSLSREGKFVWFSTGHQIELNKWLEDVYPGGKEQLCIELVVEKDGIGARSCFEPKAYICELRRPKTIVVVFY
ncbi:C-type lectin 37Da-like [Drosophila ananassae]|uniref:C-type lectin 37Da-like n=1 Tax=Drosophila ananassae TaxID=7217 RepID=UPI0013A5EB38|nr:C-type lectin 37Da-like [Drosophila ananassae]